MESKVITGMVLTLFLIGMLTLAFNIQPVKASGTIYIRADGSVDPPTASIQRDGDLYTFTANVDDSIVVERDNIVVDGAGYTVQGIRAPDSKGINLTGRSNVTIKNTNIKRFHYGIWLHGSSNNSIHGNNIADNGYGIYLYGSSNNSIFGNNITANIEHGIWVYVSSNYNSISGNNITANYLYGIWLARSSNNGVFGNNVTANNHTGIGLSFSSNNSIYGNIIRENKYSISLRYSSYSVIYHNDFINNPIQVYTLGVVNVWDDGYPSGGNYWSDYKGRDANGDGIGDTPYVIDENNQDNYPLMSPKWSPEISVQTPIWMQWWFWTIVAIGIVALAGAVYFLIKRKSPTPTASASLRKKIFSAKKFSI